MIRDVLGSLDYSLCAEISLVLFLMVFIAVSLRTLMTNRHSTSACAELPLQDNWEMSRDAK